MDARRVYLLGFGEGGSVALHAAALDEGIAGVVSVAGFMPRRFNPSELGLGGLARWSDRLLLLPKLRAFVGHEERVPYDYHEVLSMIAPRPVLIAAPTIDAYSRSEAVRSCVEEARVVYDRLGLKDHLQYMEVVDYNRWTPALQRAVVERLRLMASP